MTDMIGMNVEAVRRISSGLRQKAGDIRAIEARVDAIVNQISGSWQGIRARQFVGDWHGHHRAALLLLADRVDGLGQSALNNANEQEQASGGARSAGPGALGGAAGGSSGGAQSPSWAIVVAGAGASLPHAKRLLKYGAKFSQNKYSVGRYTTSWNKILSATDGMRINGNRLIPEDLLRFKRWPVIHVLNDHQTLLKGGANIVGKASDAASIVDSASTAYFEFKSGDVRNGAADGVHTLTHGVDASPVGKSPLARLMMINARLYAEVGRAATNPEIDYSAKGIGQVVTASPSEWATAIKDSLPDLGKALKRVS